MNITKNFTKEELMASATASRLKIDNTPSALEEAKLHYLCYYVLQPLRDAYGKSIKVTSGFRCAKLNTAIKGATNSQHLRGEAADLNNGNAENKKLFNLALKMIQEGKLIVGQLIDEKNYSWIHISLQDSKHKNQILHL